MRVDFENIPTNSTLNNKIALAKVNKKKNVTWYQKSTRENLFVADHVCGGFVIKMITYKLLQLPEPGLTTVYQTKCRK